MPNYKDMHEKGLKLVADARAMMKEHEGKDTWTEEIQAKVDGMLDEAEKLQTDAAREKRAEEMQKYFDEPQRKMTPAGEGNEGKTLDGAAAETAEQKDLKALAFKHYLHGDRKALPDAEAKALGTESDPEGGYICPEDFRNQLITKLRDRVAIRKLSYVITTNSGTVGFPSFDYDGDAEKTAESGLIGEEDITNAYGKENFTPHKRARIFRVPIELVEDSSFDIQGHLTAHFAMRFGEIEEQDFVTGNGVAGPLGLLNAGFTTIDSTVATGSGFDSDDIIDLVYDVKAVYRTNAAFLMHRTAVKGVRKLKDGEGRYVWQPSIVVGEPPTLHGFPLHESEWMTNISGAVGSSKEVAIFGDFSFYWIIDNRNIAIQRLEERYAEYDQIGYKIRKRTDAAPVDSNAFRILRQKA